MDDARLQHAVHRAGIQIAIDGPAGAGKSTVGREVARRLDAPYLDTGLMYRAVAWLGLESGVPPNDASALATIARDTKFASAMEGSALLVNGIERERELRSSQVDNVVSEVSAHPEVRSVLVDSQRDFADRRCVVMVGRDIGTTVLPEAQVKLWVTASPEERARRRLNEDLEGDARVDLSEMAARIRVRDALDASRPVSPLARAPDADIVNTDSLDEGKAVQIAMEVIRHAVDRASAAKSGTETPK
jgi:cytidylate kinase